MKTFTKLAPGAYVDDETNTLHIDVPEMLAHLGLPDNQKNRDEMAAIAEAMLREAFPQSPLTVR